MDKGDTDMCKGLVPKCIGCETTKDLIPCGRCSNVSNNCYNSKCPTNNKVNEHSTICSICKICDFCDIYAGCEGDYHHPLCSNNCSKET